MTRDSEGSGKGSEANYLLEVRDLKLNFYTYAGTVQALKEISFTLAPGEVLGVVGETGSGKSVTALSILGLVQSPGKITGGQVLLEGENLLAMSPAELRKIRGAKIAMIFQDPMTFLNPVMTVGEQISEAIVAHKDLRSEYRDRHGRVSSGFRVSGFAQFINDKVIELLRLVKMPEPEKIIKRYPHELSGGMRQRAMIAMALGGNPKILIADEATTALDVTIQAQILELLRTIKENLGMSVMLITHDMGIVAENCDRVVVLYAGCVAEIANVDPLFQAPLHPYTQGLLRVVPSIDEAKERFDWIPGSVPNLLTPPTGCRFHPRCSLAIDRCRGEEPKLRELEPGHWVACHLAEAHPQ